MLLVVLEQVLLPSIGVFMTEKDKERITELRREGKSYNLISSELGLTKDSVKGYCRRLGLTGLAKDKHYCKECGKELSGNNKRQLFCSVKCRSSYWYKKRSEKAVTDKYTEKICITCGKAFLTYANTQQKYCSHGCYIKSRFKKVKND